MNQSFTVTGIQLQAIRTVLNDYEVEVIVIDQYTKEVLAIVPKYAFMLRIHESGRIDKVELIKR